MLSFKHARVFFWRFLESRNYKSQIVAHVGRKSAVAPSGTTEASCSRFFIGLDFRESTSTTRKRQARKLYPNKTPITSGVEESNSPRRALLLLLSNSSGGRFLKKKTCSPCKLVVSVNETLLITSISPRESPKDR